VCCSRRAPIARVIGAFARWVEVVCRVIGALLAPPRCAACDELLPKRAVFCVSCARSVARATPGPILAPLEYGGAIKTAIHRFKYGDRPDLARPLAHLLLRVVQSRRLSSRTIIPVPLHPTRLAERGFNQAALLAEIVSRHTGWPVRLRGLARIRATSVQAQLDAAMRQKNASGAFIARERFDGCDILLIDDVSTTGATLDACADALRAAGARNITPLTIARQELTHPTMRQRAMRGT
jgi:ComF family protein